MRLPSLTLAFALLVAGPAAEAQIGGGAPPCSNGQLNPSWMRAWQQNDRQGIAFLTGAWASQGRNPGTGQTLANIDHYGFDGSYDYSQQVCSTSGTGCETFEGGGFYAVQQQGDGSFWILVNVSDRQRRNVCVGNQYRAIDNNTIQRFDGGILRRTQ